ncbi:MAG TPA: histidine phosphatase family protein [Chloroflexota bacterium]|nr:histidine phosphatase family protein [Chloroflexota bacterium]
MQTQLILVRHGESEDNLAQRLSGWTDSDLTPVGVEQAQRTAHHVARSYQPAVVYASPLRRARRTAEPLAALTGLPLNLHDDLREIYFGQAEGLSIPEVMERFPTDWQRAMDDDDLDFGFPGGETRRAFYARIGRVFQQIIDRHAGETVAIVSHGGVLSAFLAMVAEGRPQRWRAFYKQNCAISEVVANGRSLTIVRWNLTDHLSSPPPDTP